MNVNCRTLFASYGEILSKCDNTSRPSVEEAMKRIIKQTKSHVHTMYVKDLYMDLNKRRIPTTPIASLAKRICRYLPQRRTDTLTNIVMKWTVEDTSEKLRKEERLNTKVWRDNIQTIRSQGIESDFKRIYRSERKKYKKTLCEKRRQKVWFLSKKYKPSKRNIPDEVNGVIIKDQDIPMDFSTEPRVYGNTVINEDEKHILSLPPKFAIPDKVDEHKCEIEIEKAITKLRWERHQTGTKNTNLPPTGDFKTHEDTGTTIDFRNMRPTDLPFNGRVYLPPALELDTEVQLHMLKQNLQKATEKYKRENDEKEDLTSNERKGLKSLTSRVKNKDIVILSTDKSGRHAVDTPENYRESVEPHIRNDIEIDREEHDRSETIMNAHAYTWLKILRTGEKVGGKDRIKNNLKSRNSEYAVLSSLRKDHKVIEDPIKGPPGRPLCSGNVGYNYRFSHLICMFLKDVTENEPTECENTEDLIAKFKEINVNGVGADVQIGSMDVKALYPSLEIDHAIEIVCKEFVESRIKIDGINTKELTLYIALTKTQDEIDAMGLQINVRQGDTTEDHDQT